MNHMKNIADQILPLLPINDFCHEIFEILFAGFISNYLPLQLIQGLHDSILSWYSFLELMLLHTPTYCLHKYMRDQILEYISSKAYILSLSVHKYPASWQQTQCQKLMSLLFTNSFRITTLMLCSHISRNHFSICKTLCPLHDCYPQTCRCQPSYIKNLGH